jgi:8-oxo-dGTP diphosphatase
MQPGADDFDESVVLSASCHNAAELDRAQHLGCEFALLSAVRKTQSHPGFGVKGWYGFNRLSRETRLPVYALGGVERKDLSLARYQGAVGVAGIGDFWSL